MNLEINNSIQALEQEGIILCPTDTIWGLSCDATNTNAVEKIYKIKKRDKSKSLIVLVSSLAMLEQYVGKISKDILEKINAFERPTTVIYSQASGLAHNLKAADDSVGIRIVSKGFCHHLIAQYQKPIVSSSANFSNEKTPDTFETIDHKIKEKVRYVVAKKFASENRQASRVVKIENGKLNIIRA